MPAIDLKPRFVLDEDREAEGVTIHDIDTCIRKPLVVAVGSDRALHVYDYENVAPRRILSKTFPEEPRSVSLHPTGMHALVGFSDKLRLVHVLSDDARVFWETSLRGCRTASFSRGGQAFAAAHGSLVSLYDFYGGSKVRDLRGHNAKVSRVLWSRGDASLLSLDEDGNLYRWDLETGRRAAECVLGSSSGLSTFAAVSKEAVWVATHGRLEEMSHNDLRQLRVIEGGTGRMIPGPVVSSHEESSMVFVGTAASPGRSADAIRIYSFIQGDFVDIEDIGAVSLLHVSHDDRTLFVVNTSGRIAVHEVNDRRGVQQVLITARRDNRRSSAHGGGGGSEPIVGWCRNVLISENSIEEGLAEASDLRGRIDELNTDQDYRLRAMNASHAERVKKAGEEFRRKSGMERLRIEQIEERIQDTVREFEGRTRRMHADNERELAGVEEANREELLLEVDKYQKGSEEWERQRADFAAQNRRLVKTHAKCREELESELQKNLQEKENDRASLEQQVADLRKTLEEMQRQLEEDVDAGIESLKQKMEGKLSQQMDTVLKYAGENGILLKKTAATLKDIEEKRETVKTKLREREDMADNIIELQSEIDELRMAVRAKEEVVVTKDAEIKRLQKKQDELRKFRYVLGDRIKNYAGQMRPRDDQAKDLCDQIDKVKQTLEHYDAENERLGGRAAEVTRQIEQLQKKVTANMKTMNSQDAYCKRLLGGLDDCTQLIQKPDLLVRRVKSMVRQINAEPSEEGKSESHDDLIRRRDDLLRHVASLKEKQARSAATNQKEKDEARGANEDLLEKINALRESNRKEKIVLRKQQEEIQNALLLSNERDALYYY